MSRPRVLFVCTHNSACEACPYVPAPRSVLHQSFEDPSAATGTEVERLAVFRRVRDEIRSWLEAIFVSPAETAA